MHIRSSVTGSLLLATVTLAGLPGCQAIYHEAIEGHPAFPAAGMLPPFGQDIVAAAPYQTAAWSQTIPVAPVPPPICQAVIEYDNSGGQSPVTYRVTPSSTVTLSSQTMPSTLTISTDNYANLRDVCIETYVGAIDYQYNQYKRDIYTLVSSLKATGDALQSLASAGAAGIGGSAAQILSGISAGIGALNTGIDNQVLYKNTIVALIQQMDADRKEQLGVILQRMGQQAPDDTSQAKSTTPPHPTLVKADVTKHLTINIPATSTAKERTETINSHRVITSATATATPSKGKNKTGSDSAAKKPPYTMYAASVDLLGYFDAGTVAHALTSIQKSAGAKATNCQAQVNNLKTAGTKTGTIDSDLSGTAAGNSAPSPSNPAAQPGAC